MSLNPNMLILSVAILGGAALIASNDRDTTVTTADGTVTSSANRGEIEEIVVETIMAKPEVIIESIEKMQERQADEEQAQARDAVKAYKTSLFEDSTSPFAGNPDGDVVMVEFFDYNCGYCQRALPSVARLIEGDKNLKVIFKDYPVLSPTSDVAARAAVAMNKLNADKYFDYHTALFNIGGKFDNDTLASLAAEMGVDKEAFLAKMDSEEVKDEVEENKNLARKLGARGVPLFVIGEELFPGAIPYEQMKDEIDKARASKS